MEIIVDRSLRHWWFFLIRGILFILLGIYMIAAPAAGYVALGFLFGLIILVAGVSELLRVVREKSAVSRGWHLAIGLFDIIAGIALIGHITASETILRIVVALWFLFKGISLLGFSGLRQRYWPIILGGVIITVFGLFILFSPAFGAATIILWTAFAFALIGIMNIMLSIRMKSLETQG